MIWVLLIQRERKLTLAGKPRRSKLRLLIAAVAGWIICVFGLAGLSLLLMIATEENEPKGEILFGAIVAAVLGVASLVWWLAMRRKGETGEI
ncbi:MAG: hypothetical protein ABL936_20605 [Aestuariivirga sp.]